MIVVAAGYMGTGSSAIIHLLKEYSTCTDAGIGRIEHLPLYTPHGLFDLEDRLLRNNTIHNSDAAIEEFYLEMKRLNDNNFGFCGAYQKRYGKQFMEIVEEFIDDIVEYKLAGTWSYDYMSQNRTLRGIIKDGISYKKKKSFEEFGRRIQYRPGNTIKYSFITSEKFYRAARKFIKNYCDMIRNGDNRILLFNQLLLPHNLYRLENYFEEEVKVIVCNRDARDMFVLSKYIWPTMGNEILFPADPREFIRFYRGFYGCEKYVENSNVLRIFFEQLIYEYDETVQKIEKFIGISEKDHVAPKTEFEPDKSINNTQNYLLQPAWEEEIQLIEKELSKWIYPFPFRIVGDIRNTFDK